METAFVTEFQGLEVRQVDGHHELTGIAVPYGRVTDKTPGRRKERFAHGAFASAIAPAVVGKVRLVDENHLRGKRPAGVAVKLEEREAGLFSRWRFYDTPEGRAAYENAREGTYGGLSVGFVAVREHDVDGVREILEAQLHHVSLVDEPAYDDARILAVRAADLSEYAKYGKYEPPELVIDDTPLSVRIRQILV